MGLKAQAIVGSRIKVDRAPESISIPKPKLSLLLCPFGTFFREVPPRYNSMVPHSNIFDVEDAATLNKLIISDTYECLIYALGEIKGSMNWNP